METVEVVVEVNQKDWCCLRMGNMSYFLTPRDNRIWKTTDPGIAGVETREWERITFDQVPEPVRKEYMLWRLSK